MYTIIVPLDHLLQRMHQCLVLGVYIDVYVSAVETWLLYTTVGDIYGRNPLVSHRAESHAFDD